MNKTFKKILSIALAIIFVFGSVPIANLGVENLFSIKVFAEEDEEADLIDKEDLKTYGDYVYYVENNEVTIFYYTGEEINITIPSKIEGMPVKKLESHSFSYYQSACDSSGDVLSNKDLEYIESVYIPDTVEYIGSKAFHRCSKLQHVRLSANLKEIGEYAFSYCTKLSDLRFTGNKLEKVGECFIGYTPITDITFPGGGGAELTICAYAFRNSAIKNITIQSDYVKFERYCFWLDTGNAIQEIVVGGEITYCDRMPFGSTTNNPKSPLAFIVKNKPIESVYESFVGVYRKGYIDNYQGKGWTYFSTSKYTADYLRDENDDAYVYFLNGDNAVITDYDGGETETIIVPETLGGKPVTEIGHGAFKSCDAEYIELPDTVNYIGVYAFDECTNLKGVKYNTNNEISFGTYAFDDCHSLEEFVFSESVKKISDCMFYDCTALSSVTAPGATEIGEGAFYNCSNLETVQFSEELHTVGPSAFYMCQKLKDIGVSGEKITNLGSGAFANTSLENFTLSEEITEIPRICFAGTAITSIILPENLKVIGSGAFSSCENLGNVVIPDSVEEIGGTAFRGCINLTSIVIPQKVEIIGAGTFMECENLESVILPDNLKMIETRAFRYCISLESIDFPESLVEIGDYAFEMCENLSGEIRLEKNLVYVGNLAFGCTNLTELYYNIPDMEVRDSLWLTSAFHFVGYNGFEKITIGNDVKVLPGGIFKDQKAVETIVIPDSVVVIEKDAFGNCTLLKNLTISDSVTEIGVRAFEGCSSLTEFTVPKNTKSLGKDAIPKTVTTVYFNAENCEIYFPDKQYISPFADSSVEKVIIGNTVKRIPDYFFSGYDYEKTLIIPDSVTEIGKYAFKNSSVKSLALPQNLISIEEGTFSGSDIELSDNSLPESLRMIGKSSFENCDSITELYIPDSVLDIDESAFYDCDSLVKVRMSPNVKLIPESAFRSCDLLATFEWNSDVKLIGEYAFAEDMALADFDFVGVEKIYPNSFTGSGVNLVMLGENKKEEATELEVVEVSSFENCANLETLSIGGNVATIKSAAFANCGKLETAVISPTVTNIAVDAFDGCDALTIYCVEESYAHEYALNNGIPVSTFVIDAIPNQVYTGKEIEPDVNVKVSDKKLTENTDFAVKYSDNINVGTAKVLVSGKGIYKVLASVANFTIITKNVENITVSPVVNQIYDGSELKPEITVTNGDKILTEGVDYTVTYKNNTEAGTATAEITGIGNYSGKTTVTFEIVEQTFWQKVASFFEMIINAIVNFFRSIFK